MFKPGLYGTEIETFGIDVHGRIWTLQTPDTWPEGGTAYQIATLPENAEVEPVEDCALETLLGTLGRTDPTNQSPGFLYQRAFCWACGRSTSVDVYNTSDVCLHEDCGEEQ